jgi:sec-independent protein translocase protein TatA
MIPGHLLLASILSPWHLLLILAIVLLLFGGSRLPDLMRSLGRSVTEFKKGISEGSEDDNEPTKKIDKP